jgi:divalent metal cation (Fe/Co/Zn/Cd) transporter
VANQPRYRDAAILLLIAGVLGMILGLDIGWRAMTNLPESSETAVWAVLLLIGAGAMFYFASVSFKRAKQGGNDAF